MESMAAAVGIDLAKLAIERGQHTIDDATDHAQRMRRRNTASTST
jgi:hypothetical protein